MLTELIVSITLLTIGVNCKVWQQHFTKYDLTQFSLNETQGINEFNQINSNSDLNVQIYQDALNIIAKLEYDRKVSSGWVETNDYFPFKMIEIRAALPEGSLLRPIIQLTPPTEDGRIDLLIYNQSHMTHGIHAQFVGDNPDVSFDPYAPSYPVHQFNMYKLIRTNDSLKFFVNDQDIWTFHFSNYQLKDNNNPFAITKTFKIVMNVGVGGHQKNERFFSRDNQNISIDEAIDWSCSAMIIDYIRVINQGDSDSFNKTAGVEHPAKDPLGICSRIMTLIKPTISYIPREQLTWIHGTLLLIGFTIIVVQVSCVVTLKNASHYNDTGYHIKKKDLEIDESKSNSGFYGEVFQGYLIRSYAFGYKTKVKVAVKIPKTSDETTIAGIMREANVMRRFRHNNVLLVFGVCLECEKPMVIMPFMDNGDILSYIKDEKNIFDVELLTDFAKQIAKGMEYLAEKKYVHRDLAARNCMLDSRLVVKVSDFGLTRHLYNQKYYRKQKNLPLPYPWMAIECMEQDCFTTASDVWSYGVVLWELFTRGRVPYAMMNDKEVFEFLSNGKRLPKTDQIPDNIYKLAFWCWIKEPGLRPRFLDIVSYLDNPDNSPVKPDIDNKEVETRGQPSGVVMVDNDLYEPNAGTSESSF